MKETIYPCLWFDGQAKQATDFYRTVFADTIITADTPMVVTFESAGQKFMCLNGGPAFKPNAAVSFFVVCTTKDEVDAAWQQLTDGGRVMMPLDSYPWSERYGWVEDRFGVNWQLSFGRLEDVGQKFTPVLMFTGSNSGKAEEAIGFYTSVFSPSSITGILRYSAGDGDTEGNIKHAQFELAGNVFMAMDSSLPHGFSFTEGVSFVVECDTQDKIDFFWHQLTSGGAESMCGWLKDRYGVSWQIVPAVLKDLMQDSERAPNVAKAFMQMKKFDIEALVNA